MSSWLFHLLFWNGNNGVTVFFAISGFLITLTSIRRFGSLVQMRPHLFYRIRFARIAPLLLCLVSVLSALHFVGADGFHILPQRTTLPHAVLAALAFHVNWLEAAHGYLPANWDVLWSLSIEEVFYLFFPLVCILIRRTGRLPLFSTLLLILVAMGPFARTAWTTNEIWREKSYLGCMDSIALGCLFALATDRLIRRDKGRLSYGNGLLVAAEVVGAGTILLIALWPRWRWLNVVDRSGLDETLLALATCFVMTATVVRQTTGSFFTSPLRWLGRHSYEIYLTHEFAVVWGTQLYVKSHGGLLPLWYIGIAVASVLPGALIARFFSEPLNLRLRPRLSSALRYSEVTSQTVSRS